MTDTVAVLSVDVKGRDVGVAALLAELEKRARQADRALDEVASGAQQAAARFRPLSVEEQKAEAAALRLAQAAARVDTALAQQAAATSRAASAAAQSAAAQDRAAVAALRRAQAEERAARASGQGAAQAGGLRASLQSLAGTAAGLGQALGAIGVATGIAAIGQFALEAGKAAVQLERTQATVRAVAGSQERYSEVLRLASANQQLFGGSTQENIAGLQQFLFISNRAGASLEELNKVAQLLSVINPLEGFEGAGVALSEFFAGDVTSIVERFNLPRAAIRELTAEGVSAEQKLAGLTALLAEQGITAETLSASLTANAQTYTELGAQASQAFTNIGASAAAAAAPVAQFITAGLEGFNQLVTKGQEAAALAPQIFAGSVESYDAYIAKIGEVNAQLATIGEQVTPLSEAQFQFAQSLIATGATAEQAFSTVAAATPALDLYSQALGQASKAGPEAAAAIQGFEAVIVNASTATAEGALQTQQLIQAYLDGTVSADQLAVGLSNVELTATLAAQAKAEAAAAAEDLSAADQVAAASMDLAALAAQAEEQALRSATQAAFEHANAGGTVEEQARAAADALLASGDAGAAAADRLAQSSSRLDQLTAAYYRLEAAALAAAGATGAAEAITGVGVRPGTGARAARPRQATAVRGPVIPRVGGAGGRARGGGRSAANTQAEKDAERRAEIEEGLTEKLADINERYYERAAAAEEQYQERILEIARDYNDQLLEDQRDFQAESIGSKANFYDTLTQADIPPNVAADISAQYEAAYAEAQRLSQEGKADQAAAYLALKQEQLRAELEFQAAVAKAREEGDANEIARLEAIKRLRDQEFQARFSNLEAEGDANVNARDAALADAEARRQEEIAKAAAQAGDAIGQAQEAAAEKAAKLNKELQTQIDLLSRSAGLGGPVVGPGAPPAGPPPPPAPGAAAAPGVPGAVGAGGSTEVTSQQIVSAILNLKVSMERLTGQVAQLGRRSTVAPNGGG